MYNTCITQCVTYNARHYKKYAKVLENFVESL